MERLQVYRAFTAGMAAFLRGEKAEPFSLSAAQWGRLYALAKRQGLAGALFLVTEKQEMPDAVSDRLRRQGFLSIARAEAQQRTVDEIAKAFSDKEIAHLFFKGAVVRRYYPDPAMRSMGDIDMAIKEDDRRRADAAMTALSFSCTEKSSEVWVYERDGVMVEMHTLVRQYDVKRQETVPYDTLWTDARLQKGATFHLNDVAEAVHAVHHLTAHFASGGCGIRQLMDVAVLYERLLRDDAWDAAQALLERDALAAFARRLLGLCARWDLAIVEERHCEAVSDEIEIQMLCRLLDDGIFGKDARMLLAQQRRDARGQTGGALGKVFVPADYIKRRFDYVAKHPWLLPVGQVHRLVQGVTKNRRVHERRRQYAAAHEEELAGEIALFDAMGL